MPRKHTRLQVNLTPHDEARLERLKGLGVTSNAEAVRNALRLYEWFLNQKQDGWSVVLVNDDEEKEVELVF